jgi:hypothetical protein
MELCGMFRLFAPKAISYGFRGTEDDVHALHNFFL